MPHQSYKENICKTSCQLEPYSSQNQGWIYPPQGPCLTLCIDPLPKFSVSSSTAHLREKKTKYQNETKTKSKKTIQPAVTKHPLMKSKANTENFKANCSEVSNKEKNSVRDVSSKIRKFVKRSFHRSHCDSNLSISSDEYVHAKHCDDENEIIISNRTIPKKTYTKNASKNILCASNFEDCKNKETQEDQCAGKEELPNCVMNVNQPENQIFQILDYRLKEEQINPSTRHPINVQVKGERQNRSDISQQGCDKIKIDVNEIANKLEQARQFEKSNKINTSCIMNAPNVEFHDDKKRNTSFPSQLRLNYQRRTPSVSRSPKNDGQTGTFIENVRTLTPSINLPRSKYIQEYKQNKQFLSHQHLNEYATSEFQSAKQSTPEGNMDENNRIRTTFFEQPKNELVENELKNTMHSSKSSRNFISPPDPYSSAPLRNDENATSRTNVDLSSADNYNQRRTPSVSRSPKNDEQTGKFIENARTLTPSINLPRSKYIEEYKQNKQYLSHQHLNEYATSEFQSAKQSTPVENMDKNNRIRTTFFEQPKNELVENELKNTMHPSQSSRHFSSPPDPYSSAPLRNDENATSRTNVDLSSADNYNQRRTPSVSRSPKNDEQKGKFIENARTLTPSINLPRSKYIEEYKQNKQYLLHQHLNEYATSEFQSAKQSTPVENMDKNNRIRTTFFEQPKNELVENALKNTMHPSQSSRHFSSPPDPYSSAPLRNDENATSRTNVDLSSADNYNQRRTPSVSRSPKNDEQTGKFIENARTLTPSINLPRSKYIEEYKQNKQYLLHQHLNEYATSEFQSAKQSTPVENMDENNRIITTFFEQPKNELVENALKYTMHPSQSSRHFSSPPDPYSSAPLRNDENATSRTNVDLSSADNYSQNILSPTSRFNNFQENRTSFSQPAIQCLHERQCNDTNETVMLFTSQLPNENIQEIRPYHSSLESRVHKIRPVNQCVQSEKCDEKYEPIAQCRKTPRLKTNEDGKQTSIRFSNPHCDCKGSISCATLSHAKADSSNVVCMNVDNPQEIICQNSTCSISLVHTLKQPDISNNVQNKYQVNKLSSIQLTNAEISAQRLEKETSSVKVSIDSDTQNKLLPRQLETIVETTSPSNAFAVAQRKQSDFLTNINKTYYVNEPLLPSLIDLTIFVRKRIKKPVSTEKVIPSFKPESPQPNKKSKKYQQLNPNPYVHEFPIPKGRNKCFPTDYYTKLSNDHKLSILTCPRKYFDVACDFQIIPDSQLDISLIDEKFDSEDYSKISLADATLDDRDMISSDSLFKETEEGVEFCSTDESETISREEFKTYTNRPRLILTKLTENNLKHKQKHPTYSRCTSTENVRGQGQEQDELNLKNLCPNQSKQPWKLCSPDKTEYLNKFIGSAFSYMESCNQRKCIPNCTTIDPPRRDCPSATGPKPCCDGFVLSERPHIQKRFIRSTALSNSGHLHQVDALNGMSSFSQDNRNVCSQPVNQHQSSFQPFPTNERWMTTYRSTYRWPSIDGIKKSNKADSH